MSKRNILIIGATGKVGGAVVNELKENADINVIASVRSADKKQSFTDIGVETRILDLDDPTTLPAALKGIDSALLLTGYTVDMMKQSKRFIDEAKKQGVDHIVHIGASGAPTTEVAHWGWHQMIEAYIEQQGFRWTHLRPEAYMQNVTGPGFKWLNDDVITHFIGNAAWSWVDATDVAAVAAQTLLKPDEYHGQVIQLGYDAKDMNEVADILSKTSGKEIGSSAVDPQIFHDMAIEGGMNPAYIHSVFTQFSLNTNGKIPEADKTFDNFEKIVGRPPVTWDAFAEREKANI